MLHRGARVRGPGYPEACLGMPRDEACRACASMRGRGTRPRMRPGGGVWIALGSDDPRMALWAIRAGCRDPMDPRILTPGSWDP